MTDDELKEQWSRVSTPLEALETLSEHRVFVGSDPYYHDLDAALWEMVDRIILECGGCGVG